MAARSANGLVPDSPEPPSRPSEPASQDSGDLPVSRGPKKEPATGVAWRRCSRHRCNHDRGVMETLAAIVVAVAIVTVVFLGIIVVSAVIWLFLFPR